MERRAAHLGLTLGLGLDEDVAAFVMEGEDVTDLVHDDWPGGDGGSGLRAGTLAAVVTLGVVQRHQRHLLGWVDVQVVGQLADEVAAELSDLPVPATVITASPLPSTD
ncbi:hypothetical protein [Streptomyces sp. AC154]|uniref:hypothetical protein n=1 Tax=Streptomyces sp. AC154 TaxID=3143184 RepID=UPI003F7D1255